MKPIILIIHPKAKEIESKLTFAKNIVIDINQIDSVKEDIDLIIGGHTHTFLDKPTVVNNKAGKEVLVNQVGCYGINLGRIDFYFDSNKKNIAKGKSIIV